MQLVIVRLVLTHSFEHSKQWDPVQYWEEVISLETATRYPIGRKTAFCSEIKNSLLSYALTESSQTVSLTMQKERTYHSAPNLSSTTLLGHLYQNIYKSTYITSISASGVWPWGWLKDSSPIWSWIIHSCNNWQWFLDCKNIKWALFLWAITCCDRDARVRNDLILFSWHVRGCFKGIHWALLTGVLVVVSMSKCDHLS